MLLIVDFIFMLACTYSETPRVNGAPWIRKSGTLSIQENLVVTSAYSNRTDPGGGGRETGVSPGGGGGRRGDYDTAEVRNFAFQASRSFQG